VAQGGGGVKTFITAKGSVYTNGDDFEVAYSTSGERFEDRRAAIRHGMARYRSDDFNIATVEGEALVAFGCGFEDFDPAGEDLPDVARQLGLEVAA
jgi:hypothetical protein